MGKILNRIFGDIADKISIGPDFLFSSGVSERFAAHFSSNDVHRLFEKAGVLSVLRNRGFSDFSFRLFRDENFLDRLELFSSGHVLIDLRISKKRIELPDPCDAVCDFLNLEWLSSANPGIKEAGIQRLLPGQRKSGLGILNPLMRLMEISSSMITEDGYLSVPDHLHLALMYSSKFRFMNPETEALVRSVRRDLKKDGLYNIAWAYPCGAIVNLNTGNPVVYEPGYQIYPVSRKMKKYFSSDRYQQSVRQAMKVRLSVDYTVLKEKKREILRKISPEEV